MPETRPDLSSIEPCERIRAQVHWYTFLLIQQEPSWAPDLTPTLRSLEMVMQPETLHRLAMARGRYEKEVASCDH